MQCFMKKEDKSLKNLEKKCKPLISTTVLSSPMFFNMSGKIPSGPAAFPAFVALRGFYDFICGESLCHILCSRAITRYFALLFLYAFCLRAVFLDGAIEKKLVCDIICCWRVLFLVFVAGSMLKCMESSYAISSDHHFVHLPIIRIVDLASDVTNRLD